MIAFSGFNFGACTDNIDPWQEYVEAIQPYVHRMWDMAPEMSILVAQIGSVAEGGDKSAWLVDTIAQLSREKNVVGLIYFNVAKPETGAEYCPVVDWRVYDPQINQAYDGLLSAMRILEG